MSSAFYVNIWVGTDSANTLLRCGHRHSTIADAIACTERLPLGAFVRASEDAIERSLTDNEMAEFRRILRLSAEAGGLPVTSKRKTKQPITFSSLHIEVLGPGELSKSRVASGCVTNFLRTVEHNTRHLLREFAKISSELKGFRVRFD